MNGFVNLKAVSKLSAFFIHPVDLVSNTECSNSRNFVNIMYPLFLGPVYMEVG